MAEIAHRAAAWLAKRDRGLTATEQDELLLWLAEDPRHGEWFARHQQTVNGLKVLAQWRPEHGAWPNPDLLAQRRARRTWCGWGAGGLAAAASLALAFSFWQGTDAPGGRKLPEAAPLAAEIVPVLRRLLEDGSTIDLNRGAEVEVRFTAEERLVRLVRGEAHFTVTKIPARPFIVEANGVGVRAVGTAFNVRQAADAVEVLVTEGQVQVERPVAAASLSSPVPAPGTPTALVAGERAIVDIRAPAAQPVVAPMTPTEIARALSWQGVRLEFAELALAEVVTEFNLRNRQQLVVGDAPTGRLRVGGSFRADNVDAFVRLLEASFGVSTQRRADGALVLRHQK